MTVAKLIRELKKHPLSSEVGIQDHDAGEHEVSAKVHGVSAFDPAKAAEWCSEDWVKGVRVVIRAS